MRYADDSAFNRRSLGDAAGPAPSTSRGQFGNARGGQRQVESEPEDDDWFASRRGANGRPQASGGRGGGVSSAKKQHIHFGSDSRDRFASGGGGGGRYSDRDSGGGGSRSAGKGPRAAQVDSLESMYGREEGSRSYRDSPRDGRSGGGRSGGGGGGRGSDRKRGGGRGGPSYSGSYY